MRSVASVEALEPRRLLAAAGGPLVAHQFVGPPEGITSVVLTFNVPLDPATAQNPQAYELIRKIEGNLRSGDPVPAEGALKTRANRHLEIESATYDAAANTVTIVPTKVFSLATSLSVIAVHGRGPVAVLTADGKAIDGDGNGRAGGELVLRFRSFSKGTMKFREADGDRATLKLQGNGVLLYYLPNRGRSAPSVFVRHANPAGSILAATLKKGAAGDGVFDIGQLNGASTVTTSLLSDPAFRIRVLVP